MTTMGTLVPALKRELAVPGTFDDVFPDTGNKDLAGTLADAYSEAKIDGFFKDMVLDSTMDPTDAQLWTVTPDFSEAGGAIVVIYASMRIIRAQLRVLPTSQTYKAGSVEYSTSQAATLLRDELAYLQQRQKDIVAAGKAAARTCSMNSTDGYLARLAYPGSGIPFGGPAYDDGWGGFFPYEYRA